MIFSRLFWLKNYEAVSYSIDERWTPLLSARPAVTFPAEEHHCLLAGTRLYCLVTEAHRCKLLAQGHCAVMPNQDLNLWPVNCKSIASPIVPPLQRVSPQIDISWIPCYLGMIITWCGRRQLKQALCFYHLVVWVFTLPVVCVLFRIVHGNQLWLCAGLSEWVGEHDRLPVRSRQRVSSEQVAPCQHGSSAGCW